MANPSEGDLKVWHIAQIPGPSFEVPVRSVEEAGLLLDVLDDYDLFQFRNNIKPDYSNVNGVVVFEDGDWWDWRSGEGEDFRGWWEEFKVVRDSDPVEG